MKTAIQQLKEKIQVVIGEMNGELNLYESGYKQCLINIQNDIDLQMMGIEKEQIIESYCQGALDIRYDELIFPRETSEEYYNELYK